MNSIIRVEQPSDYDNVYSLLEESFEEENECELVKALHTGNTKLISYVAEIDGEIVGQIILSKMSSKNNTNLNIYGLAPMCVDPEYQNNGIGSKLVEAAVSAAKNSEVDAIFVLGHASYYPKFGFVDTSEFAIDSEYDVPSEYFMVLDITGKLDLLKNDVVVYSQEFLDL